MSTEENNLYKVNEYTIDIMSVAVTVLKKPIKPFVQ